jgi:hypothetical protein
LQPHPGYYLPAISWQRNRCILEPIDSAGKSFSSFFIFDFYNLLLFELKGGSFSHSDLRSCHDFFQSQKYFPAGRFANQFVNDLAKAIEVIDAFIN